jgi:hypothetical protein
MDVKTCTLKVTATVKYFKEPPFPLEMELTFIEGDDILDLIEREVLDYVNVVGNYHEYQTFTVNRMSVLRIKEPTTCWGCLENQANQQAHAQYPGDCLYSASPI